MQMLSWSGHASCVQGSAHSAQSPQIESAASFALEQPRDLLQLGAVLLFECGGQSELTRVFLLPRGLAGGGVLGQLQRTRLELRDARTQPRDLCLLERQLPVQLVHGKRERGQKKTGYRKK